MKEYIEMVAIPEKRDIATITAEIRMINQQTVQYVVRSVVELGRRLCEAKSMLPHGQWGQWLRDEVGFSQSTAQNYMKIFEEYSADQLTLDGAVANSQTLGNLSYTKALKLLALPAEEREEFVEANDVEGMSTRELERAIKERDEARREVEKAKAKIAEAEETSQNLREISLKLQTELADAKVSHSEELVAESARAEEAKRKAEQVEAKAAALMDQLDELRKKVKQAEAAEQGALAKLEELKKNPVIPKAMKDKLKEDASAEAKKVAEKDLEQERSKVAELERQIREAGEARKRAEAEAERIRKELATSAPEVVRFKVLFEDVQKKLMEVQAALEEMAGKDPDTGSKMQKAVLRVLDNFEKSIGEVLK